MAGVHGNSFGNYFSTGPISSGNFIRQANITLVLPVAPDPLENNISLWTGMGMSYGDLIQALAVSYPGTKYVRQPLDSREIERRNAVTA
jgi:uncharacterized protein YaaQ